MNPNEVFYNTQQDYQPLQALMRAKGNLMAAKNKPKAQSGQISQNSAQNAPQIEMPQTANASAQMQSPFDQKFRVSQEYGVSNPKLYQGVTADARHHGVDFATPEGTQLKSPIEGQVEYGQNKWYGNFVKIKADDGTVIQFSHLKNMDDLLKQIDEKQRILAGQLIGLTGNTGYSTGPHVDVMAWRGGKQINPMTLDAIKNAAI